MATFSGVTRQHILQAIAEYDTRGRDDFLGVYGFTANDEYAIVHGGTSYDLPAVLGVAHRFGTGRLAPAHEITASLAAAVTLVRKRGFEVTEPTAAVRSAARSSARAKAASRATTARATSTRRSTAAPERVAAICPTCSTTLPGTGICDYCC